MTEWTSGYDTAKIHVGYAFFRVDVDKKHQKETNKKTYTLYNEKGKRRLSRLMACDAAAVILHTRWRGERKGRESVSGRKDE